MKITKSSDDNPYLARKMSSDRLQAIISRTGSGIHGDRRAKRNRTRRSQKRRAIQEHTS